ncbi:hypothetical protein Hypma_015291 [Hypsizygus marmoreus]|uniref:DUF6697 domain-containing protein n=1 Tax=Hypsizygus marmoreus TaxID=39966 RepID=A0A369KE92_HYPMA|nr:hypothetical protein Hypma_015291 [Hypsizygus marmoreus]
MDRIITLQQLVKTQAEQLSNIRQLLDESVLWNDLLWHELEALHQEVQSQQQRPSEPPPSLANDAQSDAGAGPSEAGTIASEAPSKNDSWLSTEPDNAHLHPFCSRGSPWQILKAARKASFQRSPLLIVGDEIVFTDPRRASAMLIKPQSCIVQDNVGILQKLPYNKNKWSKEPVRVHEMICRRAADWMYLGTYETSLSKTLEPAEFEALSAKVKKEIFALTCNNVKRLVRTQNLGGKYASGEFKALQMDCRRVEFNEEFNACIFEAAGLSNPLVISDDHAAETGNELANDSVDFVTASSATVPLRLHSDSAGGAEAPEPSRSTQSADEAHANSDSHVADDAITYHLKTKPSRKDLKVAKKKRIVYIKREEFVTDLQNLSHGFEVIPLQRVGKPKAGFPIRPPPQSLPNRPQEVITRRGQIYRHLGTYNPVSTRTLDVAEFESLPSEVKERVYRITGSIAQVAAHAAAGYASGQLKAARVDFERVGLSQHVRGLLERGAML